MSAGRPRWLPIAAVCLTLTLGAAVGCSRTATESTDTGSQSQAAEKPDKPKTPTAGTDGRMPTIADYLKQNKIGRASCRERV